MIIIFILSIVLFILSILNFYKKHYYNKDIDEKNKQLETLNRELELNKNNLKNECENLDGTINKKLEELNKINENLNNMEGSIKNAFSEYCEILQNSYTQKEQEYEEAVGLLNSAYIEKQSNLLNILGETKEQLTKLKSTLNAAAAAHNRQEEMEENVSFYCLSIDKIAEKEISAIKSIEYLFRDSRPLNMMIWSNYYLKPANNLCNNILGSKDKCGIYKITNINNKKCYIGQSKNIRERLREHMKHGLGIDTPANNKLYKAMEEEGLLNFSFELIEECLPEELDEKEKFYIDLYSSYANGYNNNRGIGVNKYIN